MAIQETSRKMDEPQALVQDPGPHNNDTIDNQENGEDGEIEEDVQAQTVVANNNINKKKKEQEKKAALEKQQRQTKEANHKKRNKKSAKKSAGGVAYIPPAKRKLMLEQQQQQQAPIDADLTEEAQTAAMLQRQQTSWNDQRRVIHGTINRLNAATVKPLIQELFQKVNLVRLRGILCKNTIMAAMSSPKYANVYAALISVVNSKLPEVGELAVGRSILAFRKHYQRREKASCQAICIFLAHLFHQAVVHELLILQILSVLLDGEPTDDSVEVAVQLLQTTGHALLEVSPAGVRACLERLRALLHEGQLNKRVEYQMEQLLKLRKTAFRDLSVPLEEDLDLVERDDQITHELTLDDQDIQREEALDTFHVDTDFEDSEKEWAAIRAEILGDGESSSDDDDGSDGSDDSGSDDDNDDDESEASEVPDQELALVTMDAKMGKELTVVQDLTEQDLVHLRRTIYLTIMSSATFEEATHKLARIDIPEGREMELINMLIECCSQERTFLRYYGLIAARFCLLDDRWRDAFMESFKEQYTTIHRLETNKLRNVAKLFAHLLHTDSVPWSVLEVIHLNEDETTSSSRIFVKIIIQEMAEAMGIAKLKKRFESQDAETAVWYAGMFPKDNVRNTRYAINFFTSIGLGPLTDDLREFLKNAPKLILAKAKEAALAKAKKAEDSDDSSSVTSSSSSSSSSTYSSSSSGSYSSGSSSSSSSHSLSGRSSRRRRSRRSRSSSNTSSSSKSRDSRNDSRQGGRRRRRRISRSRSRSPPKEIVKKDQKEHADRDRDRGGSVSPDPKRDTKGSSGKDRNPRRSESPQPVRGRKRRTRSRSSSKGSDYSGDSRDRDEAPTKRSRKEDNDRNKTKGRSDAKPVRSDDKDSRVGRSRGDDRADSRDRDQPKRTRRRHSTSSSRSPSRSRPRSPRK